MVETPYHVDLGLSASVGGAQLLTVSVEIVVANEQVALSLGGIREEYGNLRNILCTDVCAQDVAHQDKKKSTIHLITYGEIMQMPQ